jgi:hypothetical protein
MSNQAITFKLAGSLGLSCVRGARREVTENGNTSDRGLGSPMALGIDERSLKLQGCNSLSADTASCNNGGIIEAEHKPVPDQ